MWKLRSVQPAAQQQKSNSLMWRLGCIRLPKSLCCRTFLLKLLSLPFPLLLLLAHINTSYFYYMSGYRKPNSVYSHPFHVVCGRRLRRIPEGGLGFGGGHDLSEYICSGRLFCRALKSHSWIPLTLVRFIHKPKDKRVLNAPSTELEMRKSICAVLN